MGEHTMEVRMSTGEWGRDGELTKHNTACLHLQYRAAGNREGRREVSGGRSEWKVTAQSRPLTTDVEFGLRVRAALVGFELGRSARQRPNVIGQDRLAQ